MQERIRYYITKSGEELTVRSVKVAKSVPQRDDPDPSIPEERAELKSSPKPVLPLAKSPRRRVNDRVPRRSTES